MVRTLLLPSERADVKSGRYHLLHLLIRYFPHSQWCNRTMNLSVSGFNRQLHHYYHGTCKSEHLSEQSSTHLSQADKADMLVMCVVLPLHKASDPSQYVAYKEYCTLP